MIEFDDTDGASGRKPVKSEAAFRTISEVSEDLDVPQHVLRFWESKFSQIKPLKRGGGRRYYRPEDLALLKRIRDLLYKDGYTIKGVQKLLREQPRGGAKPVEVVEVVEASEPPPELPETDHFQAELELTEAEGFDALAPVRDELEDLLVELEDMREMLRQARRG